MWNGEIKQPVVGTAYQRERLEGQVQWLMKVFEHFQKFPMYIYNIQNILKFHRHCNETQVS